MPKKDSPIFTVIKYEFWSLLVLRCFPVLKFQFLFSPWLYAAKQLPEDPCHLGHFTFCRPIERPLKSRKKPGRATHPAWFPANTISSLPDTWHVFPEPPSSPPDGLHLRSKSHRTVCYSGNRISDTAFSPYP